MSDKAKHTPGKWHAKCGFMSRVYLGDKLLATAWDRHELVDETQRDGESWLDMRSRTEIDRERVRLEANANARLIAAAPDLLEALQDIVKRNEIQNWFNTDLARKAIAKATNEE